MSQAQSQPTDESPLTAESSIAQVATEDGQGPTLDSDRPPGWTIHVYNGQVYYVHARKGIEPWGSSTTNELS
jgi:hypothetical protein